MLAYEEELQTSVTNSWLIPCPEEKQQFDSLDGCCAAQKRKGILSDRLLKP